MGRARKLVLVMEYNGTRYCGFQLQANQPTVQAEIETALLKLTGEGVRVIAASRTDSGVHARGQVVSLRTESGLPPKAFVHGLNHFLPRDIAVKAAYEVRGSLDIRRDAVSREYRYYLLLSKTRSPIWQDFAYLVTYDLDIEAMGRTCQYLVGEHDFASFATRVEPRLKNTVRRVYQAGMRKKGDLAIFTIVANSFLSHQVRNTVGTLLQVGTGKMNMGEFCSIIEARQFGRAGPTIPAHGLFLMRVNYPEPWRDFNEDI